MRTVIAIILLCLISLQLEAKKAESLSDAVNQAKTEGRVLSARTVDGRHEVKILTNSGTVKTINKPASNADNKPNSLRSDYFKNGGKSRRNDKQNSLIPNHFNSQQKVMKIDRRPNSAKSASRKNKTNKKNKNQ
ncbi:hypothetical protein [Marinicella litoralis]|uniref:YpeB-like protein with protease inhibitory function n=1 Tax=Marinicella litoralis TaxID=644220 RepID=A0A4R6XNP7_9GAMM|nr:hypothetical protein [Marinicella litoralis]TDR19584.1 hypothetical protein C8D91_2141 [Marinicella litoralis]